MRRLAGLFFAAFLIIPRPCPALTADQLEQELRARITRVPELRFLREQAKQLGVRVWLFGGTAAGFAHYVSGICGARGRRSRFQTDRFDYDYTNIYRSTQDLDIVVDGTPTQARALREALVARYPHMQGSKSAWEVRLLRASATVRRRCSTVPNFCDQHTDSNSTGMIEVSAVRRSRSSATCATGAGPARLSRGRPRQGKLHYYFSPRHETTTALRRGLNPPIFSVDPLSDEGVSVRAGDRSGEDRRAIRRVIDEFDRQAEISRVPTPASWIERNGKKLFGHAVNIEYAVKTLDELGLRKKLCEGSDPAMKGSLGWWLSREPLRSRALGTSGKSARELGIDTVAHETSDFLAYESITRAHTGDPNVLTSRAGAVGETAAFGDGFYTRRGRTGARGTGLTIRFTVDPNAREGSDFFIASGDYIVFRNKAALKVIPESLSLSLTEYFQLLANDDFGVTANDRGILEKFKRRLSRLVTDVTPPELTELRAIAETQIGGENLNKAFWQEVVEIDLPLQTSTCCSSTKSTPGRSTGSIPSLKKIRYGFCSGATPTSRRDRSPPGARRWSGSRTRRSIAIGCSFRSGTVFSRRAGASSTRG